MNVVVDVESETIFDLVMTCPSNQIKKKTITGKKNKKKTKKKKYTYILQGCSVTCHGGKKRHQQRVVFLLHVLLLESTKVHCR